MHSNFNRAILVWLDSIISLLKREDLFTGRHYNSAQYRQLSGKKNDILFLRPYRESKKNHNLSIIGWLVAITKCLFLPHLSQIAWRAPRRRRRRARARIKVDHPAPRPRVHVLIAFPDKPINQQSSMDQAQSPKC